MIRLLMIAPLVAVLVAVQAVSVPAWADPTPQQIKCQWKKQKKAGRYQSCVQNALVEEVKSPAFDLDAATAACAASFETAWELQDTNAADAGEECLDGAGNVDAVRALLDAPADRLQAWLAGTRWVDNGDGTATDSTTGLQWELKTEDGSVHDKHNVYTWCVDTGLPGCDNPADPPDGTAFTAFLVALNGGVSADGSTTTGCFAGKCDWRLPTIGELRSMLDAQHPNCIHNPCTSIPGLTQSSFHWSSSTKSDDPALAWVVIVHDGNAVFVSKEIANFVRAVRGGS